MKRGFIARITVDRQLPAPMFSQLKTALWSTPRRKLGVLFILAALTFGAVLWGLCLSGSGPLCKPSEAEWLTRAEQRIERQDYAGAQIELRNLLRENPSSARGRLVFAQALLGSGDASSALQELNTARQHGVAEEATWVTWASALLAQGQIDQVAALFADKRHSDPAAAAKLQTLVARAHLAAGRTAQAKEAVEAALGSDKDHVPARVLKARLMAVEGQLDQARQASDAVLTAAPQDAEAWQLRADLLSHEPAKAQEALAAYRKAVELGPRLAEAHGGLTTLLLNQRDAAAASAAADAMRQALPRSPLAAYFQALTAFLNGDLQAARERMQKLQVEGNPRLLMLAGTIESRLGNLAQAETYLLRALQTLPNEPRAVRELAALYLQRGQADRTLVTLESLLASRQAAPDAQAWRLAGQAHLRLGEFDRADQAFKQVKRLLPEDRSVELDAARLLLARGSVDAGILALEASAQAETQGIEAEMDLVAAHMARADHKAALTAAERMTRKLPAAAAPWLIRGRIQAMTGDAPAARESYGAALKLDPKEFVAIRGLAELDLAAARPDVAKSRYEEAIKRDPRSARLMLALADLTRRTGGTREQAAELVDKAVKVDPQDVNMSSAAIAFHRDGGDTQRALSSALAAQSAMPDEPRILLLLAEAQLSDGAIEQATANLNRAAELRPGAAEPQVRLAEAYLVARQPERALAAAEKALVLAPEWVPASRAVIGAAVANQRLPRARAVVKQWQQKQPRLPLGWQLEADIELSQRQWDAGIAALRTAIGKGAGTDSAWMLHRALTQSGRAADARQQAEAWLRDHPQDTTFLNLLGDAALARGDLAGAEARFAQALKIQPQSPTLMNNVAYAQVLLKKPEAKQLALKAAQAAPYSAPVLDTLAQAFAAEGNAAKAVEVQTQVVDLMPRAINYRIQLARFHLQAGDKKKAREELERIRNQLGTGPMPADVQALAQRLDG